jgi:LysR family hydrogen peroxide-inducible transcriptional activator
MGTIPTVGPFLLPRVLPGLHQTYGRLKLYLVEDLTDRLISSLHRGELDVVLLALPRDCGPVETFILFEDAFWSDYRASMLSLKKAASDPSSYWVNISCC